MGWNEGMICPTPHYYQVAGGAAEIARASGMGAGPEHLFLAMLHDGGWPVSAISGLIDPARAEEAIRVIMDGPNYQHPPAGPNATGGYVVPPWGARVAAEMGDSHLGRGCAHLAAPRPPRPGQLLRPFGALAPASGRHPWEGSAVVSAPIAAVTTADHS